MKKGLQIRKVPLEALPHGPQLHSALRISSHRPVAAYSRLPAPPPPLNSPPRPLRLLDACPLYWRVSMAIL